MSDTDRNALPESVETRKPVPPPSLRPEQIEVDPDPAQRQALRLERIDVDPESVQQDLARLVLTIVELLRQLMERQALRRVDEGDLTDEQIEKIGTTLMILDERMAELREHFGLGPEDLNLDLGPLGSLLPEG